MSATSVLIVDHEPETRRLLQSMLIARAFEVSDARSGEEALEKLHAETFNVILLDSAMPHMSAVETCSEIRSHSEVPIIFLSVCNAENRKVEALENGADDYIVRPVGMEELVARIRALLRRASGVHQRVIALGNVRVGLESREVRRLDTIQHLATKEFKLFYCLVSHAGTVVSHRRLLRVVWGPDYGDELGYLRVLVNQLRRKVEPNPARPEHILTEPREGYRFVERPVLQTGRGPTSPLGIAYCPRLHLVTPNRGDRLTAVIKKSME